MFFANLKEVEKQKAWQDWGSNPFEDEREEQNNYRQIYNDLLEFRKMINRLNDEGILWPTPMNGKTWMEEQNEWFSRNINAFQNLIREGKVKSCEIKTLCEAVIREQRVEKSKITSWTNIGEYVRDSGDCEIHSGHSIDELIDQFEQHLNGNNKATELKKALDSIGKSACEPRACIEFESEESLLAESSKAPESTFKPNITRII